ncbi:MAG TPA: hypothetical protein VET46_08930, partial [Steroidobacteraceae bacterium]|nr:hypothetical protein [Steroidobacteraceae bacterium]
DNCARLVKPHGFLYVMLYRDAYLAPVWRAIKRTYTRGGPFLKWILRNGYAGLQIAALLAKGRNPWRIIRDYAKTRGMSWYIDSTDWIGGYPFEYTNAERVIDRLAPQGFQLVKLFPALHPKPVGWQGTGSYQYLFQRRS